MLSADEKQLDDLVFMVQKQIKQLQNSTGWENFAEGKVQGYKKKSQSDSIITKAETVINFSLEKVIDFFMKGDSMKKMNDMVLQNKIIHEKNGKYKIFHLQMKTPFPLDNRETVSLTTSINEGNKFYIGAKSCNYPIEPTPKFVMAWMNISGWIFEKVDNNRTKVTNYSDFDPRGNIPDMIKNTIAEKRVQSLKDLQSILKKEGY